MLRKENTPAGVHAVAHGKASAATRRQELVLAVVVIVVPAFVAVMVPAGAMMLDVFCKLPHILFPGIRGKQEVHQIPPSIAWTLCVYLYLTLWFQ